MLKYTTKLLLFSLKMISGPKVKAGVCRLTGVSDKIHFCSLRKLILKD